MTAGANLDTTLEPALFLLNTADDGHHPEVTGGWDNFYVMFRTDTGTYSGVVKTKVTDRRAGEDRDCALSWMWSFRGRSEQVYRLWCLHDKV